MMSAMPANIGAPCPSLALSLRSALLGRARLSPLSRLVAPLTESLTGRARASGLPDGRLALVMRGGSATPESASSGVIDVRTPRLLFVGHLLRTTSRADETDSTDGSLIARTRMRNGVSAPSKAELSRLMRGRSSAVTLPGCSM
jgi:hypothetical protein